MERTRGLMTNYTIPGISRQVGTDTNQRVYQASVVYKGQGKLDFAKRDAP